jgi:signal transduction histidine kinase/ActR/RegA family two-component response regulator
MVPVDPLKGFRWRAVATGLAMAALLIALLSYDLWRAREKAIATAFRETSNLTNVFEEYTARTFQAIDGVLGNLSVGSTRIDMQEPGSEPRLIGILIDQLRNHPQVASFGIVDDTGQIIAHTRTTWDRSLSFSDRDYFTVHRDNLYSGIFIGSFVRSRMSGEWLFIVSRRLERADGTFAGIVFATMDLRYFAGLYASIDVGANGGVTLIHRDGTILARAPNHDDFIGKSAAGSEFFRVHLPQADRGSLVIRGAGDASDLFMSYRGIPNAPLVISVAFADSDVLADWNRSIAGYVAAGTGLIFLISASVILAIRGRERHIALVEARRAREAAQRETERMAQLQRVEEQLHQAQKMEAVGQLTGGIAHDFNNLLMVVLGNLDEVADRLSRDDSLRPLVRAAIAAAERGADLTQQLLAFARRQPLRPQPLDCNEIIQSMADLLRRTLGERIDIHVKLAPDLPAAVADAAQVQNALLNLTINARDAMPDGGTLVIETSVAQLDEDYRATNADVVLGDYLLIAVSDTGVGMSPAVMARAFEPFFTTKEIGKGSGLGLSMVYGFAKQSGGHAKIYSEVGQGTTVKLYLPVAPGSATAIPAAGGEVELAHARKDEAILVVEDDVLVRDTVTRLLRALGYRVLEAAGADAALAVLHSDQAIDLLFTDVVLPGRLGGRELAVEGRKIRRGLRVLFTSGYTQDSAVHQGRLDDGVFLLSKPYKKDALARTIRGLLDQPLAAE